MSIRFQFDAKKAVEVILYIAEQQGDMYTALKVLYFADKMHLADYGRFICGDSYSAMGHGPVPSATYDIVKYVRGDKHECYPEARAAEAFRMRGNTIIPLRGPDRDLLSESDMECLDTAIKEYAHYSFRRLRKASHDQAFTSADQNDFMSVESIARTLPDGALLVDYLESTR